MNALLRLFAPGLLLASAQAADPPRQWTARDGTSKFMGNLIGFSDKEVTIRRSDNFNRYRLSPGNLSQEDQGYPRTELHEWLFQQHKHPFSKN